jgi:hypothetical protein
MLIKRYSWGPVKNSGVSTAELDDSGAYGDWPEDFDDTERQAEKEYLDAVETKAGSAHYMDKSRV